MVTSLCLYRVKSGSESAFKKLLAKHGANRAHEIPDVMAVWEPMGKLCEARDGRPAMEFPIVKPIEIRFVR